MIKLALKNGTNATVYKTDLIQEIGVERSEAERENANGLMWHTQMIRLCTLCQLI